jgi:putative addiction module killer protein
MFFKWVQISKSIRLFGDAKSVGEGINELRISFGPGYRVYFGMDGDSVVILLLAGDKKTQSVDIKMAQEYWLDYRSRDDVQE